MLKDGPMKLKNKSRGSIVSEMVSGLCEDSHAAGGPALCSGSLVRMTSSTGPTDGSVQASRNGNTDKWFLSVDGGHSPGIDLGRCVGSVQSRPYVQLRSREAQRVQGVFESHETFTREHASQACTFLPRLESGGRTRLALDGQDLV